MINESKIQLFEVFKNFDKDASGYVDQEELKAIAKQLDTEITQKEIDSLMAIVDSNKDGKISFEEFWNWWQFGKNAKLERLVYHKLKLMGLLKQVHSEFTRFGVSLNQVYEKQYDNHYMAINYGDNPNHVRLEQILRIGGAGIQQELTQLQQGKYQITIKDNLQLVLMVRCAKPDIVKPMLDKILQDVRDQYSNLAGGQSKESQIYQFIFDKANLDIDIIATQDQIVISLVVKHEIVQNYIEEFYLPYMAQMGEDAQIHLEFNCGIRNGFKKLMKKNSIFIKYLLEGFLIEMRVKFNTGLAKKVFGLVLQLFAMQMSADKAGKKVSQAFTLPLLLKSSKVHLVFKNMEQVDAFLRSMGLEELVEDQPSGRDLIQEILDEDEVNELKDPQFEFHFLYKIIRIFCEHMTAQGAFALTIPQAFNLINFSLDGLKELYETLLRDDPDSIKEKQEKEAKKAQAKKSKA